MVFLVGLASRFCNTATVHRGGPVLFSGFILLSSYCCLFIYLPVCICTSYSVLCPVFLASFSRNKWAVLILVTGKTSQSSRSAGWQSHRARSGQIDCSYALTRLQPIYRVQEAHLLPTMYNSLLASRQGRGTAGTTGTVCNYSV